MKLVRFGEPGRERPGIVDRQGHIRDVSRRVSDWSGEALDPARLAELSSADIASFPIVSADTRLGPPASTPGKIVCVGLNYADHAAETGFELPSEPLVFFKSPTAICGPTDPIRIPRTANAVDWEVELACVIGRPTRDIREDDAMAVVAGFAVANDVTERSWQFDRGGQWSKAKSADTFAPQIRAFLLERGVAVRQGLRFLRAELRGSRSSAPCYTVARIWLASAGHCGRVAAAYG
jgi:2-keto-4-pentenoate hydratase/2-oxohepta-3-ene-1,7-dioic acid hydratase in catechol pathway